MKRTRPETTARGVALDVLLRVEDSDGWADVLLAHRLAETALGPEDRALASALVYGVLAWQGRLDHHLGPLVRGGLGRLDPPVRAALRLGLLQLLFLERVPPWAAVDTSVELARRRGPGAAGLVNAVLRRVGREGAAGLSLPDAARDPIGRLAVEFSHPRWLVERWAAELGHEELPALLEANNRAGEITLRTNRVRTDPQALAAVLAAEGGRVVPARFDPDALVVAGGAGRLRHGTAWQQGRFAFQGEASQLVGRLVAPAPGARVLDACAAPGGKTTLLAAAVGPQGLVVGLDPHRGGARRIAAEAARLGARAASAVVGDARHAPLRGGFDAVLVDAPCSGLGTLRRHPELRWRREPDDLPRLAALQQALLDGVAPLVRPGGALVYAVCTIAREECNDVVTAFLGRHPGFVVEPATAVLPPPAHVLVDAAGFLRTFPHRHGLDGFFAARLRAPG